jgi:hypothetical protein
MQNQVEEQPNGLRQGLSCSILAFCTYLLQCGAFDVMQVEDMYQGHLHLIDRL